MSAGAPTDQDALTATRAQLNSTEVQAELAEAGMSSDRLARELFKLATESLKDEVRLGALREVRAWVRDKADQAAARAPTTLNTTVLMGADAARLAREVSDLEPDKRRAILQAAGLLGDPDAPVVVEAEVVDGP